MWRPRIVPPAARRRGDIGMGCRTCPRLLESATSEAWGLAAGWWADSLSFVELTLASSPLQKGMGLRLKPAPLHKVADT